MLNHEQTHSHVLEGAIHQHECFVCGFCFLFVFSKYVWTRLDIKYKGKQLLAVQSKNISLLSFFVLQKNCVQHSEGWALM